MSNLGLSGPVILHQQISKVTLKITTIYTDDNLTRYETDLRSIKSEKWQIFFVSGLIRQKQNFDSGNTCTLFEI